MNNEETSEMAAVALAPSEEEPQSPPQEARGGAQAP
jgi:hypothetical protein